MRSRSRIRTENELSWYEQYCASFTRERAAQTELSYLIMPVADRDVANLDRWYERDGGERVGNYNLYRLRLRGSGAVVRTQANASGLDWYSDDARQRKQSFD